MLASLPGAQEVMSACWDTTTFLLIPPSQLNSEGEAPTDDGDPHSQRENMKLH